VGDDGCLRKERGEGAWGFLRTRTPNPHQRCSRMDFTWHHDDEMEVNIMCFHNESLKARLGLGERGGMVRNLLSLQFVHRQVCVLRVSYLLEEPQPGRSEMQC